MKLILLAIAGCWIATHSHEPSVHEAAVEPARPTVTLPRNVTIERPPVHAVLGDLGIAIEIKPGVSVTAGHDPSHVVITWESGARPPGIDALIAKLGSPTSGACWMSCSWGDHITLTEQRTRVKNSTTLELR